MRRAAAEEAVKEMLLWFEAGGIIAILDATNSSKERRRWIKAQCDEKNIETLFVESKCDDEELIMSNILEVKTTSPDYDGQDPEEAARDFRDRISNYEKVYETIDEEEKDLTYIKIMNVGKQVIINAIQDYLQSRVVYYLMNLHIKRRSIWLSRVSDLVLHPLHLNVSNLRCPLRLDFTNLHYFNKLSTENRSGMFSVKLAETQSCLHVVRHMLNYCLSC